MVYLCFGWTRLFWGALWVFLWTWEFCNGTILHMMWTTPAVTMQPRHLAVLQSYLLYHPDWRVRIYITDFSWGNWRELLDRFIKNGHDIELIPISDLYIMDLVKGPCKAASAWTLQLNEWRLGRFFFSHLTDLLRFCLLLCEGGVYSDFDALLLRPLSLVKWLPGGPQGRVVVGKDRVPIHETCTWCLPGQMYLAPGVMIAEPGAQLLLEALSIGFNVDTYDPNIFNSVGPRALTIASRQVPRKSIVQLSPEIFYPVNYQEASNLFKSNPQLMELGKSPRHILESIIRHGAYSLHFFGAQTKHLNVEYGSIIEMIMSDHNQSGLAGPEYFLTDSQPILLTGIRLWFENSESTSSSFKKGERSGEFEFLKVTISVDSGDLNNDYCSGETLAQINTCLSQLYFTPDEKMENGTVTVSTFGLETLRIPIYNLSGLLTITIKTMDRMSKVFELISSLRTLYPRLPVIVANDGHEANTISPGIKRGFTYLPLPFDTGLSQARNIMVDMANTPLVMILDDDFVFTNESDLGYLVHQLFLHKLDIVAATSPVDHSQHGIDYSGLIQRFNSELHIKSGNRGSIPQSTCMIVDIVPNIFVARASALRSVRWDEELKLGEHEDYFLRAFEAKLFVGTCQSISLIHKQEKHWLNRTLYDQMRGRVWKFLQTALLKHNLTRLVAFGMTTMKIQGIQIIIRTPYNNLSLELHPEDLTDLKVFDLQPFSVAFRWSSPVDYHFYQIDIFDITDLPDENPGEFLFKHFVEPSLQNPTAPTSATILGLDPDRYYRLVLRPANHTQVHSDGPEFVVRTPPYEMVNLLINGDFDGSDVYWERSLGAQCSLVSLHSPLEHNGRIDSIPSRPGYHSITAQAKPLGNYAISLYISAGPNNMPSDYGVGQYIPAAELPEDCHKYSCQISVSAWARVDRLFGPPAHLLLELRLKYVWLDGKVETFSTKWDPYEETRWQPLAFSTGLNLATATLDRIEVWAWLSAPRGAVFFDDFYLSARPIIVDGGYL